MSRAPYGGKPPARLFAPEHASRLPVVEDIESPEQLARLLETVGPDLVVNCIAVGRPAPADPMRSIAVYSVLPQRLSQLCRRSWSPSRSDQLGRRFLRASGRL